MQVFLVGKTFTQSSQLGVYELNVFHNGQHFTLIIIILMNLLLNALFPKGLMSQNLCYNFQRISWRNCCALVKVFAHSHLVSPPRDISLNSGYLCTNKGLEGRMIVWFWTSVGWFRNICLLCLEDDILVSNQVCCMVLAFPHGSKSICWTHKVRFSLSFLFLFKFFLPHVKKDMVLVKRRSIFLVPSLLIRKNWWLKKSLD
jgi:hypothetical protein